MLLFAMRGPSVEKNDGRKKKPTTLPYGNIIG